MLAPKRCFPDRHIFNLIQIKFGVFWVNTNEAAMDVREINMINWMSYSGLGFGNQ